MSFTNLIMTAVRGVLFSYQSRDRYFVLCLCCRWWSLPGTTTSTTPGARMSCALWREMGILETCLVSVSILLEAQKARKVIQDFCFFVFSQGLLTFFWTGFMHKIGKIRTKANQELKGWFSWWNQLLYIIIMDLLFFSLWASKNKNWIFNSWIHLLKRDMVMVIW